MVEPINLNRARKSRDRVKAKAQAVENRVRFGRTREARGTAAAGEALQAARLDGHRRERDDG